MRSMTSCRLTIVHFRGKAYLTRRSLIWKIFLWLTISVLASITWVGAKSSYAEYASRSALERYLETKKHIEDEVKAVNAKKEWLELERKRVEQEEVQRIEDEKKRKALAAYIYTHYPISDKATELLATYIQEAAKEKKMDMTLIAAVMAKESGFNPFARSKANAEGLMQLITQYHLEKLEAFGGKDRIIDPKVATFSGAEALKEFISKQKSIVLGLQQYNGALEDKTFKYANSVNDEKKKMDDFIHNYLEKS